jgi:ribosomal protein L11 methyltransferase
MVDKEILEKSLEKSFWQVVVEISKEAANDFESFMMKSGAIGFHEVLYEEGKTDNLNTDNTIHYYYFSAEFPVHAFVPMVLAIFHSQDNPFEIKKVNYSDFLKIMEETFEPLVINRDLTILPPWKSDAEISGRKLIINPAFAFGTGRHATTNLMLNTMENIDFKDKNVLDMGMGSGVLTIYALMLGAKKAVGVDVENLSVESSLENYELNKKTGKFNGEAEFFQGDFSWANEHPEFDFEIFLSNILPDVFYQNKTDFFKCIQKSRRWILSGIVVEKKEEFLTWLKTNGNIDNIDDIAIDELDGWCVFWSK